MQSLLDFMEGYVPVVLEKGDEGYDMNEVREKFIASTLESGLLIVYPEDNQLQIDIDNNDHWLTFLRSIEVVARNWEDCDDIQIEVHPSKSGLPRRHVTIALPGKVDQWQRIALQACLGSDPVRELLSATRLMRGDVHPTLFVEKPKNQLTVDTSTDDEL